MDVTISARKIVVIGGAGLVGSHIVDQLIGEDIEDIVVYDNLVRGKLANLASALNRSKRIRIVQGSITDRDLLRRGLQGADGVFLLAALWLGECVADPRSAIEVNVVGTFNVIEACLQAGVGRVVYSSSASVYGDALTTPMTEDHPFNNRTMYGATKIAGEQFFRAIYQQHRLDYVGLRYMNVYGPRMDYKGTYVSVIMKVLDRIAAGLPPVIFGDGSQSYDFVHVEDVARANLRAMQSQATDEYFNVGTGQATTINELTEILLELTGSKLRPEYRPQEQSFVTNRLGSTDKAENLLGFRATIPLRQGLRSVVEWRQQERLEAKESA
jgi:UDP-glucose 4-epimerase